MVTDGNNLPAYSGLLSNDVRKIIYTTKTKEDVAVTANILQHFVETTKPYTDFALLKTKGVLLKDFMILCRTKRWLEPASSIWKNKLFMSRVGYVDEDTGALASNMPTVTLCYLDILYEKKKYEEVIEEVKKLETLILQVPSFVYVLGMMSCLKLNTKDSLESAMTFYNGKHRDQLTKISRFVHPYALLLCRQGNPALAFEIVSLLPKRTVLRSGLMVYLLTRLNRPTEACVLLEGVLTEIQREDKPLSVSRGQGMPKLIFSLECVQALTKVVEKRQDVALNARLAGVFTRLDSVASITDRNMVELISAEIDAPKWMKYKRGKNKRRTETKGALILEDGANEDLVGDEVEISDEPHHR